MSDAKRFTVYFDGTGNNKDLNTPEGTQTNVARLFDLDTAKGTNLARNSGHPQLQYDAQERSGQSEKIYFDGVGSQAEKSGRSLLEGATGRGAQERIDQAYGRGATSGMVVGMDEHHILQKVGQTDQFVIHDRRDVDPSRNFQVGKSTAIVNERGLGEVARDVAPKLELDMGLAQAMRR